MGSSLGDGWQSDNKNKPKKEENSEIKMPEKHQLYLAKEKRRGKIVTIVKPFYLAKEEIKHLLKALKKKLGTGGTQKKNTLEFQGEVEESLRTLLEEEGYRFRI